MASVMYVYQPIYLIVLSLIRIKYGAYKGKI